MQSNSKKETILIESFDVLKENIKEHRNKISEIISRVSSLNLDLAIEMWKYIIRNTDSLIKEDGYGYTSGIIYDLEKEIGEKKVLDIFKENDEIVEACFGYSSDIFQSIISSAIKLGEVALADQMLTLTKSNQYKEKDFFFYLEDVSESFANNFKDILPSNNYWGEQHEFDKKVEIANQACEVLLKWVETITDKEQRARLNVTLIDYV